MFVHFLFPNICAEGYFQSGDLGILSHRLRYVKVSESKSLICGIAFFLSAVILFDNLRTVLEPKRDNRTCRRRDEPHFQHNKYKT